MAFPFRALSENLYYPLVLFTVYILARAVEETGNKWKAAAGFFVGLCFLTRYTTAALILGIILSFTAISLFVGRKSTIIFSFLKGVKSWGIIIGTMAATIFPWLLRNGLHFGFTIPGMLGYTGEVSSAAPKAWSVIAGQTTLDFVVSTFSQIILHNGFLILGSGIVFFVFSALLLFKTKKENNERLFSFGLLIFLIAESYILLTAWHHFGTSWRLMGRYSEPVIPLFIIFGLIGLRQLKQSNKTVIAMALTVPPLISLVQLHGRGMGAMLPISNIVALKRFEQYAGSLGISNSFLSTQGDLLVILSVIAMVSIFIALVYYKVSKKLITIFAVLILLSSSFVGCTAYVYANKQTKSSSISELGRFLNDEISGENDILVFEKNITLYYGHVYSILASWINSPIRIINLSNESVNYPDNTRLIVSLYPLNYTLIYNDVVSDPLGETLSWKPEHKIRVYVYEIKNERR
jgi:hypothetical protein